MVGNDPLCFPGKIFCIAFVIAHTLHIPRICILINSYKQSSTIFASFHIRLALSIIHWPAYLQTFLTQLLIPFVVYGLHFQNMRSLWSIWHVFCYTIIVAPVVPITPYVTCLLSTNHYPYFAQLCYDCGFLSMPSVKQPHELGVKLISVTPSELVPKITHTVVADATHTYIGTLIALMLYIIY
ncbi:MAG: hypothetical protein DRJ03_02480 [Chloroflexi bacterium]|nr:MAG: hypothetical protein DRJ03_02480 [Chloroflexota bacterium]